MHKTIEPGILYFGTPVALISTLNENGLANLAPMSSAWWLGWTCMLGLGQMGETAQNLIRSRECVINLPSAAMASFVDKLAMTTGTNPVPDKKRSWGYRYEPDKFGVSELTQMPSVGVGPPRVAEWQPLIMSFCRFFQLGGEVHPSKLTQSKFMIAVR